MDIEGSALNGPARGASGSPPRRHARDLFVGLFKGVEMWRLLRDQIERDKWKVFGLWLGRFSHI
jgi:hypothetical protein